MSEFTAGRENGHRRPKGYADWRPQRKTRELLEQVDDVLKQYADYLPLTVRQVFYRLVGAYGYPKDENAYARLCEHLVRARRARIIPFGALRDDGVTILAERCFAGPAEFWDHVARQAKNYTRDKQAEQPFYVELWCEAAGMMPQLEAVADDYSVPVYSCGGFSSLTAVRHIVNRALKRKRPTVLLHVGDLDPSGESIFDSMTQDAIAFVAVETMLPGLHRLVPERVALTREQVEDYALPTAPPKPSDSRSKGWTGGTCQAEALPPDVLAEVVREAIEDWVDIDLIAQHREAERAERIALVGALPPGSNGDATP